MGFKLLSCLGLLLFATAAGAQEAPGPMPQKVISVEGVTEYLLENGARVLLFPDPSRPTLTVNMTVLVGSRHEGYGEAGMAHLLEHMVFKGTPAFPDVPRALRDHGASFNGTTNEDRTNYFETLPATDENLEFAIHLESDRLVHSHVRREDLVSEFTVVRNEFERGENSPQGVLSQRVQAAAYEWHNYGKSTIGNRSDIERVPIDRLQAFYRNYYQPDNVVLIITGKFEEARALELVSRHLGAIPRPERKLNATYTEEPPQDGEREVVLRRVGEVGSVALAYHVPAASHADWAPLSILASVLSEEKTGLLEKNLVASGIATGVSARAGNSHDPGLFFFSAQPAEGKLDEVRAELTRTVEQMGSMQFEPAAVERAKLRAHRSSEQLFSNASGIAQALSSAASLGDWRLLFIQRDRIAEVTPDAVQRVAQRYFMPHNRTVGVFLPVPVPQRMEIPSAPPIGEIVRDYRGGEGLGSGEAFDPSPENLDARTLTMEIGGIQVAMLPKKNRGETVTMSVYLHYGNEESLRDQVSAASMLGPMLMAGTRDLDKQALQARMNELGVQISAGGAGGGGRRGGRGGGGGGGRGTPGQLSFSIEAKKSSLLPAIRLLGEILRQPAFPADELEQMKTRSAAMLATLGSDPNALATNSLSRALSAYPPGDPRYVPTNEESIANLKKLRLEDVKAVYRDQLSTSDGEIAIVGEFEPAEAVNAIAEVFRDWESSVPVQSIDREALLDRNGGTESIVTPDKANAVFLAGLSFQLQENDPDAAALELGNFILGGGTLSSRLGDRIRQKEGLSYGVSSSVSIPSRGNDARFTINAITNPDNIGAVETAAMEELGRFLADGPTDGEVRDAQKAWLESRKVSRASDGAIAGQMAANLHLERTFGWTRERERQVSALTAAGIRDAFRKHIDPDKLMIIRAGDFGR